jgi:hypothetical protein
MTNGDFTNETSVLDGELWLMKLVEGHTFEKGPNHTTNNCRRPINSRVLVKLPRLPEVVEIPAGSEVTFFQPYPPRDFSSVALTIFLKNEQITIRGNGHISRRYL